MSSQRSAREKGIKTEDFLLFQGRLADERRRKLKQEIEDQEMETAPFKPSILRKSNQLVQRRNERINAGNVDEINPSDPTKRA